MIRAQRARAFRVFWIVWASLTVLSALWSLATPISAAPDEPAHIVKAAAVVRGQWTGPASHEGNIVTVPLYIAWTHAVTCFAFNDQATAACDAPMPGEPSEPTESRTTAGLYNPVYYLLVGWPTLIADDNWGIYAMRIMSALVTMAFAAAAAALASLWPRRLLPWTALAAVLTPMLLFLGGVVNPNALETTTTAATVIAMVSIIRFRTLVSPVFAYTVLTVSVALGVNTRGLSPLWFVVAIGAPLLLLGGRELVQLLRSRPTIIAMCVMGASALFAVGWTLGVSSLTASITDPDAENLYPGAGQPALYGFLFVLERTISFGGQLIGLFGWMDTPAPTVTMFVWTLLIGGLIVVALTKASRRPLRALATAIGAFVFLPAIIQGAYVTAGGYIWQGRYAFPLLAVVLTLAAVVLVDRLPAAGPAARRLAVGGTVAVAATHLYTFAFVLKRYASGSSSTWPTFVRDAEWEAPGGNLVLIGLFGVIAVVSAVIVARGAIGAAADDPDELERDADDGPDRERDGDPKQRLTR
jgi:hypothetical protein